MGNLADRLTYLFRRYSENTVFFGLCVVFILSMATAFILDSRERAAAPPEPRKAASRYVLSRRDSHRHSRRERKASFRARSQLEHAGLKFVGAEAAVGTPGQVLWTRPAIGRRVPADTPVTIVVGVDAGGRPDQRPLTRTATGLFVGRRTRSTR